MDVDRKRSGTGLALIICVALFLGVLCLDLLLGRKPADMAEITVAGNVAISEVMSANRTCPDKSGKVLDYVEIRNLSDGTVDISNYKLSDDKTTIGYTFPQGTVLGPYGYTVCWCNPRGGEDYGSFGISRDGETIYLYNSANVIVDEIDVPALEENRPYVRSTDGKWSVGTLASPGYENTADGNAQWLRSIGYDCPNVVISEVQTSARYTWLDAERGTGDWVELHNAGTKKAVLDGAYLSDDPEDPLKWQIPSLTIEAGGYALIRCGGDGVESAAFALSADGGQILLSSVYGSEICSLDHPALERDTSWALAADGGYALSSQPTPGFANTADGYDQYLLSVGVADCSVMISEIQPANRSAILDSQGLLPDWVELYNPGKEPAVLDGAFLSDDAADPFKWQIGQLTLQPGEYAVIPCAGRNGSQTEASFSLSRSGCTVLLSGPVGNPIDRVDCPALAEDWSWQRLTDGSFAETDAFSPGFENTPEGYEAFRKTQTVLGDLAVYEVMPVNDRYMVQRDGEYYDWIELKNVSDHVINLADYAISDSSDSLQLFYLSQQELAPGETVVVICSGNVDMTSYYYIHAPFTLNREECWVYVTHKVRGISDYVRVAGVPVMGSAGRMDGQNGVFYFDTPTPGEDNYGGAARIAKAPEVDSPGGVYNDVAQVVVELTGEGEIYYTLDGSDPDRYSKLYTGPLTLEETTVLRARCYTEGKLESPVMTESYIINENHTLPVISIAAEPRDLFGDAGIYTNYTWDMEVPCNLTLYDGDRGFTVDCGLKMYGHTGLEKEKKSFKACFRSQYGESTLNYPVFGEDGPFLFDALCIRSGQDYPQAIFRDELFTTLSAQMSDNVLVQRHKFCILYVNGEYFGIYCMKEAFNELYYAQNRGVREESVEIVRAPVDYVSEMHEFMRFLDDADMSLDENYEYACSVFNMDSVIDWMIIEGYSTNADVQQNLRYFRSTDNGNRFEMAFYDLDWAFYTHTPFSDVVGNDVGWQHLMLTRNFMEHPEFRQKFLERTSYFMQTTLSTENVLATIDEFAQLLDPEVPRERDKWGSTYEEWLWDVNYLRRFITNTDHLGQMVERLERYIDLTQEELDTYFWRWQ